MQEVFIIGMIMSAMSFGVHQLFKYLTFRTELKAQLRSKDYDHLIIEFERYIGKTNKRIHDLEDQIKQLPIAEQEDDEDYYEPTNLKNQLYK